MANYIFIACTLLGIVSVGNFASAQKSICTDDFKQGTCVCKLNDGSGKVIDLTALVQKTTGNPLVGHLDDSNQTPYYFTFCVNITKRPDLPTCNDVASVCRQNLGMNEDLGRPQYTRFEKRTSYFIDCPTPALVTDNPFDGRTRSVAFLHCNESMSEVVFKPREFVGDRDYDGYYLYYMELTGSAFCPMMPTGNQTVFSIMMDAFKKAKSASAWF